MDRKIGNILLRIFMAIWILVTLTLLVMLICSDKPFQDNIGYFFQVLIAVGVSVWLGAYIWKNSKQ